MCVCVCVVYALVHLTYHYGWVPAGADGSGGKRVEGGTGVELFGAQVVWAVTEAAADGAALIPATKDNDREEGNILK